MNKINTNMNTEVKNTSAILNLVRYALGFLFIFSGLIKANDPMGLSFKMQEFFSHWEIYGWNDSTLPLAIIVITFEILAGIALIIGYRFKTFAWLLLLLMTFFLFLTGYAVVYEWNTGRELKCGCFGDCIPLTAQQSFWKDVIFMIMCIYLLINKHKINSLFPKKGNLLMLGTLVITLLIQFLAIRNLPFKDCLPFKVGNDLKQMYNSAQEESDSFQLTYHFNIDGKEVVLDEKEYSANEKYWDLEATKVDQKIIKKAPSYVPIIKDFIITDEEGNQYQMDLYNAPSYFFLWMIKNVEKMDQSNIDRIKQIYSDIGDRDNIGLIVLTADDFGKTQEFLNANNLGDVQMLNLNETSMKTAVRSNAGLMLIFEGKILGKWSPANYPNGFEYDNKTFKTN